MKIKKRFSLFNMSSKRLCLLLIPIVLTQFTLKAVNITPDGPITIESVSFSGDSYTELTSDDGNTEYKAPHWTSDNNYSVSYVKSTIPSIEAILKFPGLTEGTSVTIWAEDADGKTLFAKQTAEVDDDEMVKYEEKKGEDDANFPGAVKFYDRSDDAKAYKLEWKAEVNGVLCDVETTKHQIYVTLVTPVTERREETL